MSAVDLFLTRTPAMIAPPVGDDELHLREKVLKCAYPWNMLGAPALAMACGPAERGLPASIQLVGRPGDDQLVLAAGLTLERSLAAVR
jgi:aspartyl-tRNA(Asn)/glutamyl-tRNA(Gln) amidotransferase subunit A